MDRKIEMKKGNVIKNIDVNLLSEYQHLGWVKVEEKPNFKQKNSKHSIMLEDEE